MKENCVETYEGMFILSPLLEGETLEKETDFVKNEIVKQIGEIAEAKVIGRRRLAYPIRKLNDGIYLLVNFIAKPEVIDTFLKRVRLNTNILRVGVFRKERGALLNEIRD
jgi:small subunit ribosomal protein S6